MTVFLVSTAAFLGFVVYCFALDSQSLCGNSGNLWHVMCRLFAKHIKLVFKLAFWFIVAGALILGALATAAEGSSSIHVGGGSPRPTGGGPESEKFYRTMNKATAPLRWAVDGLTAICGALAMLVCVSVVGCNGLPSWKAHCQFGQGYVIFDGSHFQEAQVPIYYVTGVNDPRTGDTAPAFNRSGGTAQDGGIAWHDLGTPEEARRNYRDKDIPSTSFWNVGIVGEYRQHELVGNLILLVLYLLWLWVTAVDLVANEFGPTLYPDHRAYDSFIKAHEQEGRWVTNDEGVYFEHENYSHGEKMGYVLAAIGTWAVVVAAASWGIHWLFAATSA
jgi:hypothetical protein